MERQKRNKKIFVSLLILIGLAFILCKTFLVKAVDEYNVSRKVIINLDGGSFTYKTYWAQVDRDDDFGHYQGQWLDNSLGIGSTFYDITGVPHKVESRGTDDISGEFYERVDCVGVTPYIVLGTPTRTGYNFAGLIARL